MYTFTSQERTLIRGQSNGTITQGQTGWQDLGDHPHLVAWLAVTDLTSGGGTVTLAFQTAPQPEDALFTNISGPNLTMPLTLTTGITVTPMFKDLMTVPLARWFRWQLAATGTSSSWDVDFMLYLSASGAVRRRIPPPSARAALRL